MKSVLICSITLIFTSGLSCIFDSDIQLINSLPLCKNLKSIDKVIYYPDSGICTLSISDLNDSRLKINFVQDNSRELFPCFRSYQCNNETFDLKDVYLCLDTNLLKTYTGSILIKDYHHAQSIIPFKIQLLFQDQFDTFPISNKNWVYYSDSNTERIQFDNIDRKLQFIFGSTSRELSTGIRSGFKIFGDFNVSIELKLRDEMKDGFTVSFFVSNSADTGKWDGDIAGLFISGSQSSLKLECRSIELQNYSREEKATSGQLRIKRNGSYLSYYFYDGLASGGSQPVITHSYLPNDSVYVHLKMAVSDVVKVRHCYWNNFKVNEGAITFQCLD